MPKTGKIKKKTVVAVSGYFDPIHAGHIEYIRLSRKLGDDLVVILNNDAQCKLKKERNFMSQKERKIIIEALRDVDQVFISIDKDATVCKSLKKIKPNIFAKGGDRFIHEIPEALVCEKLNIKIVDGLGKKIQSSSKLTGIKAK